MEESVADVVFDVLVRVMRQRDPPLSKAWVSIATVERGWVGMVVSPGSGGFGQDPPSGTTVLGASRRAKWR